MLGRMKSMMQQQVLQKDYLKLEKSIFQVYKLIENVFGKKSPVYEFNSKTGLF